MIRVRVPGTLAYRNLALRVVAAACKMIGNDEVLPPSPATDEFEGSDRFGGWRGVQQHRDSRL